MVYDDDLPTGYGSLGGAGAEKHDSVKTKVGQAGIENTLSCDKCGKGLLVTVPWPELIFMARGRLPPNNSFTHDAYHGCFLVAAQCPVCRDAVRLGLTPDECGRHLRAGVAAGRIRPQDIANYERQNGLA